LRSALPSSNRQLSDGAARLASAAAAAVAQEHLLPTHEQAYGAGARGVDRSAVSRFRRGTGDRGGRLGAAGAGAPAATLSQRRERLQDESRELGEPDELRLAQLRTEAERLAADLRRPPSAWRKPKRAKAARRPSVSSTPMRGRATPRR